MRRLAIVVAIGLAVAACSPSSSDVDNGQSSGIGLPPETDQPPTTLGPDVYGSWELISGSVDGQPISIVDSHPITLSIGLDAVGGTAACNNYFYAGSLPVREGSGFGITDMACSPQEVMESEAAYLTALARVEKGVVEDGLLLVGHQGGEVELHFQVLEPLPTADLLGTVWVLEGLVQGEAVTSVSGERATLEMFTDGSFIGSTGCRDISGSYIVSGPTVQFTNFGAHGECPSDLIAQDSKVISALEGGFRVEIEEKVMTTWVAGDEGLTYRADS